MRAVIGRLSIPTKKLSTPCSVPSRGRLHTGSEVAISLDVAASEFGEGGRYRLTLEDRELDRTE
jgi:enolase